MQSCIYEGRVRHSRTRPASHRFSYRMFMMYLDLDELPTLFERRLFWAADRPAPARFRREHHLGDPEKVKKAMAGAEVPIRVYLNLGRAKATTWGCDLSEEYVTINSAYTT